MRMRQIMTYILLAVLLLNVATAGTGGALKMDHSEACFGTNISTGQDRAGADMSQTPDIATVAQCAAICCTSFRCLGFVHVENAPSNFGSCIKNRSCCYLKNALVDPTPSSIPSISTGVVSRQVPSPNILWSIPIVNGTVSVPSRCGPVLDATHVYVGAGSSLVAFDRVTGSRIWSVEANGTIESSPTASGNGRVVFGSVDGSVRSVNASTGEAMWTFASGGSVLSSPSVVRSKDNKTGAAIFGNSQGTLFSLDLLSGTVVWSLETNGSIVGTGQYDETKQSILIGTIGDGASILEAVDAQSGVSKWHQGEVLMPFCSLGLVTTPAISRDGRSLYLTCQRSGGNSHSGGGSSFALRADLTDDPSVPLNIVWNVSFGVVAGRSPLLSRSETALFVSVGSDVYAIDSATGATLWSQVGIGTNLSPTSHYFDKSGDKEAIVVGTADGDVVALNGTSGEVAWASFGVDSEGVYAAPVFGDDGVLYAAGATRLIAYGVN